MPYIELDARVETSLLAMTDEVQALLRRTDARADARARLLAALTALEREFSVAADTAGRARPALAQLADVRGAVRRLLDRELDRERAREEAEPVGNGLATSALRASALQALAAFRRALTAYFDGLVREP